MITAWLEYQFYYRTRQYFNWMILAGRCSLSIWFNLHSIHDAHQNALHLIFKFLRNKLRQHGEGGKRVVSLDEAAHLRRGKLRSCLPRRAIRWREMLSNGAEGNTEKRLLGVY